ncbi:MAG: RNA-binding protein [Acidimicrobiales bacterium]|nr:RNA-binding protein [Acidimicrobiales bacterium]
MKLLVRNLARTTTEAHIRDLFEDFGRVTACNIVLDAETGRSKGFGFVEMADDRDAKAAISHLNATDFHGARIRVKKASKKNHARSESGEFTPRRRNVRRGR